MHSGNENISELVRDSCPNLQLAAECGRAGIVHCVGKLKVLTIVCIMIKHAVWLKKGTLHVELFNIFSRFAISHSFIHVYSHIHVFQC